LLGIHFSPEPGRFSWRDAATWGLVPGWLLGLVYFGGTLWWIGNVTAVGTVLLILYIALYPAIWLALAQRIWPRGQISSGRNLLIATELASVWIGGEWVRGWLFSGFGWDGLGIALWHNPAFVQGARLGGVLLLSWLVVFVNVVAALTVARFVRELRREQKMAARVDFYVAVLLVVLLFVYGTRRIFASPTTEPRTLRIALIQPNIPQSEIDPFPPSEALHRLLTLTEAATAFEPDLVIWPESPVAVRALADPEYEAALANLTAGANFSLLMGALDKVDSHYFNAAYLFPPHRGYLQIYAKNRLVPFGEYAPFADQFPIMRKLVPFDIDFTPGLHPRLFTMENGGVRLTPLICYEDTLADYARQAAKIDGGPDLLVNITNDGWFHRSPGAGQHLANSLFRAVELDRPLLRCGNTGISAVVDQTGRVVSRLESEGKSVEIAGVLTAEVAWHPPQETPWMRYGNWTVALAALAVVGRALAWGLSAQRARKKD
jgi:apolipoprotein N-acyltransferase